MRTLAELGTSNNAELVRNLLNQQCVCGAVNHRARPLDPQRLASEAYQGSHPL